MKNNAIMDEKVLTTLTDILELMKNNQLSLQQKNDVVTVLMVYCIYKQLEVGDNV